MTRNTSSAYYIIEYRPKGDYAARILMVKQDLLTITMALTRLRRTVTMPEAYPPAPQAADDHEHPHQ